ncbi:ABC transporter ATP-binding protein [Actibacterium sp. 188UL27-1]|uniref:ABC transporter ATP-binding protein n=1 Tax=Actibacterium sp. 188UL27-1 TaxID=2786961 RepID=UPI001959441D|nr:oligopeptide/dipeptide ABC transporter ATP-binding protein [Actibacterium sp. 188UL27-1]MBM7066039.1 ATP-binding cassette domain-containing protein [Actibacterium sp. 188UL27-1]
MTGDVILEARNLVKHFGQSGWLNRNPVVQAVDDVSLEIRRGETFAIVGESGCGKSTLARLLMRLIQPTSGEVQFDGAPVSQAAGPALQDLRRDMQFIFQDPFSSLNPRMTVGKLVAEPLEVHAPDLPAAERQTKVAHLLRQVGLQPDHAGRYPHEFSGGQRQRIGIARALASGPKLIIGDEPVSALDVSVQAQVINLLGDLSRDLGLTLVIIAHDLGVIRHMSDRVAVMYLGRIVESGPTEQVFGAPRHPYTQALLASIPGNKVDQTAHATGEMPSPLAPPSGCRFHTRCPHARADCTTDQPKLKAAGHAAHQVACHHWQRIGKGVKAPGTAPRRPEAEARFELYRAASEGGIVTHKENLTERS